MAAVKRAYKLIKHGDPLLTKVCEPIPIPLPLSLDSLIDDCKDTLVSIPFSIGQKDLSSNSFKDLASIFLLNIRQKLKENLQRNVEGFWHKRSMSVAAPQVGELKRMFVMCDRTYWYHPKLMYKKFITIVNPEIIESSPEICEAWEGCISNSDELALVKRPK